MGKIEHYFVVFVLLTLLILFIPIVTNAQRGPEVKASILRYEPSPAEQGRTFDVWVQITNRGTSIDNVILKFVPEYPYNLPEGVNEEIQLGSIAALEERVEKFTVYIDPDAPNGETDITFAYKFGTFTEWTQLESPITLQTQDAVLVINDYKITPSVIIPGQTINVDISLSNAGRIAVKNVDVSLGVEDKQFTSIGSGAKKRIDYIYAGESANVGFTLASDISTEVKLYSIPVKLNYLDERNKVFSDESSIALRVNAEPEISLSIDSTDFKNKRKPGTVTLKIVNKGVVDVKYLNIILMKGDTYELLSSSNENYIGNLDSDDFETADFIIKPLKKEPILNVTLEFKDPYNKNINKTYKLPLKIVTDTELGKGGTGGTIFVIILILAGVGYWWWKKKRKK